MLFFSQYFGAKDDDGINRSYGITLICMMAVLALFAIAALFFPDVIMRIYTDKTSIQEVGVQYLRIIGFAYPFQVYSMAMSALLRSTERVRIPLYGSIFRVRRNQRFPQLAADRRTLGLSGARQRSAARRLQRCALRR